MPNHSNMAGDVSPIPSTSDELLVSGPVIAKRMSISLRMLQEQTRQGILPCVRIGRRVLYRPETIRAILAKLEQEGRRGDT